MGLGFSGRSVVQAVISSGLAFKHKWIIFFYVGPLINPNKENKKCPKIQPSLERAFNCWGVRSSGVGFRAQASGVQDFGSGRRGGVPRVEPF